MKLISLLFVLFLTSCTNNITGVLVNAGGLADAGYDMCMVDTTAPYVCGDGFVDPGEFCDDGNTIPSDGCSQSCLLEGPQNDIFNVNHPEHYLLTAYTAPPAFSDKNDNGSFRIKVRPSHLSYNDPIVFPCQSNAAHLHTFMGNTGTNEYTVNAQDFFAVNTSTAMGGPLNNTAYWIPTVLRPNGTGGYEVILPTANSEIYYKRKGLTGNLTPPPSGLRMIAGNPHAGMSGQSLSVIRWSCKSWVITSESSYIRTIPTGARACKPGDEVRLSIFFPNCWDGQNLDSFDHKSHMTYGYGTCPASHPVPLPTISYEMHYAVSGNVGVYGDTRDWFLSSDMYGPATPGGYSAHGDWFMAWDRRIINTWIQFCINEKRACASGELGNGWAAKYQSTGVGNNPPAPINNHGLSY